MPLVVRHAHLLAGAVVYSAEDVHAIVVVLCTVQESGKWHRGQLHELESLEVQDHGILGTCTVVMTAQDDYFVARDQDSCLSLH
jgi:hypothetical protein